uniref:von Willebrand factor, type A n=1 Tax=Solibacter usitatus (strain Ellin6076) TaxID=234267 RepID=Q01YS5_SOLUE
MQISRRTFLLGYAIPLAAQEPPTFSAGVDVVTLMATVRDRDGRIARDLTRDDFVLHDEGKRQSITYFSKESDLPLTIGLLVDTSRSQRGVLEPERKASFTFLDQVLRDGKDFACVVAFDTDVRLLQPFTSSHAELAGALERLRIPNQTATVIFGAIRDTAENQMRPRKGRKAFIILSDGVSVRDTTTIGTAIEYAQRADTIIYSILFADHRGLRRPARKAAMGMRALQGKKAMQRLAQETGGEFFEVSASNPITRTYAAIEETLRNQYSIGYTPQAPGKSGQYRKIKLTTRQKGLTAQTRDGYYAK